MTVRVANDCYTWMAPSALGRKIASKLVSTLSKYTHLIDADGAVQITLPDDMTTPIEYTIVDISGTAGTNTISVRVFATNETAITYTGSATGTFRIIINRKTTTTNTDQVYAEFWIGTSLIATNRTAFNNTNWFPYQFRVTQSIASQVIVDDIRNTVQKVNIR